MLNGDKAVIAGYKLMSLTGALIVFMHDLLR